MSLLSKKKIIDGKFCGLGLRSIAIHVIFEVVSYT